MSDKEEGEKKEITSINPASEEELSVAFHGAAIAANRIFVTTGSGGVRIAFTEQQGESIPIFRTAVILPIEQGIALKDLLGRLLKDVEIQLEAAAKNG